MDPFLRTERLAALLKRLAEEDGRHGAKARAAKRLGLTQSYASKIVAGERDNASDLVIEKAARSLGIGIGFFDAPGPADIDYRPFMARAPEVGSWNQWLSAEGSTATKREREVLLAMAQAAQTAGESVTPAMLSGLLLVLRMSRATAAANR